MRIRAPGLTALLVAGVGACHGGSAPAPAMVDPTFHLVSDAESVAIAPGQSKDVRFRLLDDHAQPVPERVLGFSIIDDPGTPGNDAAGATLSFDRGVTNSDGAVSLQIIAGPTPTTFHVRATATRAPSLDVIVIVTTATLAPVELVPHLVDPPVPGDELTTVRLYILDTGACADVQLDALPATPMRIIPSETTALFSTVSTEVHHPVVAVGLDAAGVPRASGCVDLPGGLLVVDVPLRLEIPLHLFRMAPEGSYDAVSELDLKAIKGADQAAAAWQQLATCPLDPARLWLDCTIDALVTSDSDPLDCHPGDDEGPLGHKLIARRGLPLTAPDPACRDVVDGGGQPSHDALAARLFPTPHGRLLEALPDLANEVARLLAKLELRSNLTIIPTSAPEGYLVDHRLIAAAFPGASPMTVSLASLGAPLLDAPFVRATRKIGQLDLDSHGFTLRLGSTARQVFAQTSLVPRGAPADPGGFVAALLGDAVRDDNGTTLSGCAALDALLCADIGEARGCLMAACAAGLTALQQRLDAGFGALDGQDLDFFLGGEVSIVDSDGDGVADALGRPSADVGIWSGEVRGRAGTSLVPGTWTAVRVR